MKGVWRERGREGERKTERDREREVNTCIRVPVCMCVFMGVGNQFSLFVVM